MRLSQGVLNSLAVGMTAVALSAIGFRLYERSVSAPPPVFSVRQDWRELASEGARVGPVSAPVVITVFSDFQCPYCAKFAATTEEIMVKYPTQVSMIFRHRPLESLHAHAESAARAAICAEFRHKFLALHNLFFAQQDSIGKRSWGSFAQDVGIADTTEFRQCMSSPETTAIVLRDRKAADQAQLTGTPLVLVNDVMVRLTPDRLQLDSLVRVALAKK